MKLIKVDTDGGEVFLADTSIAAIGPMNQIIGKAAVVLQSGGQTVVNHSPKELAKMFGWEEPRVIQ